MRRYSTPAEFFQGEALEIARIVRQETGIPISVLLAQMAQETGFGTSDAWVQKNNPAGLMGGSGVRSFSSLREAASAYSSALRLPYYDAVRQAARQGRPVEVIARLLGESPWDAGHYELAPFGPGGRLMAIIEEYGLERFDRPAMEVPVPLPSRPLLLGIAGLALSVIYPPATLALVPLSRVGFARRAG